MKEGRPLFDFSDVDLKAVLRRAILTIAILACVLLALLSYTAGWQTGVLLLVGAAISASGIYEWQRLITAVNARMDNQQAARPMGRVVTMFFLRLLIAGIAIYVSLKCLHGSIFALVGGLSLAVVGLTIEAVRLLKS